MSDQDPNNIILIGMPGVGKSTFGVVLAKILNYGFLDTDLLIQQRAACTLQSIIDGEGSQGFLEWENRVLKDVDCARTIIATGGSAVYSSEGMANLSERGLVVYLKTSPEELTSHLGDFKERGVTSLEGGRPDLDELLAERGPLYERYADAIVETQGLSINEALDAILEVIRESSCGTI